jgi:hypothetical protein
LVYEPFLGSGTTLAAAEVTERICYGMELDAKYIDVVVSRWQALSGERAHLDGDGRTFEEIAAERRPEGKDNPVARRGEDEGNQGLGPEAKIAPR